MDMNNFVKNCKILINNFILTFLHKYTVNISHFETFIDPTFEEQLNSVAECFDIFT